MAITILPPVVEDIDVPQEDSDVESMDSEGDIDMTTARRAKRQCLAKRGTGIVTPGEVVTDDPQWMRWVLLRPLFPASDLQYFCVLSAGSTDFAIEQS